MQVLKPKGRPGGLETWAPLGFSYEPIEKGNLLFPGAAPSAPAETQKKAPRPKTTGRTRPPRRYGEAENRNASFRFRRKNCQAAHVSDLSLFRREAGEGFTVTDSRGVSPHSMLPRTRQAAGAVFDSESSIPPEGGFVKSGNAFCGTNQKRRIWSWDSFSSSVCRYAKIRPLSWTISLSAQKL